MNRRVFQISLMVVVACSAPMALRAADPGDCLLDNEAELLGLINQYRNDNGLPSVSWSRSLTAVAQWHAWDQETNDPVGGSCNLHSWSDQGIWTPMCYTSDHAQASKMWSKPREITGNVYTGNGYEISVLGTSNPTSILNAWKNSSGHNDVILEQGIWISYDWEAMGGGILGVSANVWFGDMVDPQGTVVACSVWVFDDGFEGGGLEKWSVAVP